MADPALAPFLALHREGRFSEAEAGYRLCLAKGIDAALPLSALLLQQARHVEAIDILAPVYDAQPGNATAAVNLSIALRSVGRCEEALQAATRACDVAPGNPGACNARGLAALELGDAQAALSAFEQGLRHAPGTLALELHRSKALRKLHRMRDAVAALERIVAVAPDLLEAWRDLAAAQRALGLHAPALQSAAQALKLAPNDLEVALEHAVALLHAGETAKAVKRLEKLEGDAQTWMWLGQARLRQNDVQGARAALERAAALDPKIPSSGISSRPHRAAFQRTSRSITSAACSMNSPIVSNSPCSTSLATPHQNRSHGSSANTVRRMRKTSSISAAAPA
jgi:tetratricopeptide (TPR) repeat protein